MRSKKLLTIVTGIITLISLPILLVIRRGTVLYDIDLAFFGSAVLSCIMAYSEYLVARREAMEDFFSEFLKVRKELLKFPPIMIDMPLEMFQSILKDERRNEAICVLEMKNETQASDKLKKWELNGDRSSVFKDKNLDDHLTAQKGLARQIIHDYDRVIDTEAFSSAWGRIDFFNGSYQKRVYEKLYKTLINIVDSIECKRVHLHFFNTGEAKNLPVAFGYCVDDSNKIYIRTEEDSKRKFQVQCEEILSSQFDAELFDFWKKTYHPSKQQCEDEKKNYSGKNHVVWSAIINK